MITMGTIWGNRRQESSQAVEKRVYDAPNEPSSEPDVPIFDADSNKDGTLGSQSEEYVGTPRDEETPEAGPEERTQKRSRADMLGDMWMKTDAELGQRQDAISKTSPATLPGSRVEGDANTPIPDGSDPATVRWTPTLVDANSADSELVSIPLLKESDFRGYTPDFEADAGKRKILPEPENKTNELPEDVEMARAIQEKLLKWGIGHENSPENPDPRSRSEPSPDHGPLSTTIHILGLGAAGKYIAHSIAGLPFAPPVTLLMHRPLMMQHWHDEGAAIHVIKGKDVKELKTQTNFHIESSANFERQSAEQRFVGFGPNLEHTSEPPNYPISALVVTTEAHVTVPAMDSIKHRLGRHSIVFILGNGLGLVEKINENLFPDNSDRPTYVLGSMSHNLESTDRNFTLIEKIPGRLECSKFPHITVNRKEKNSPYITRKYFNWTPEAHHLMGTLARTPELGTKTLGHKSFFESQLQTLVAGAVIGPLSVMFDCTNDLLLYNYSASQTMKLLIREMSSVICSLPELRNIPNLDYRFRPERLEAIVLSKIHKSGKNLSAMLQSVRAGHKTNIDYYNGYIQRRAKELHIDTPSNEMILWLVRGKTQAKRRKMNNYIPFENEK